MSEVKGLDIYLRNAEPIDCDKVFNWRNHPSIRRFSLDPNELDYASHKQWFHQVLRDESHILLIAVQDGEDVGVIRFDLDAEKECTNLNIYVRPDKQNQGIGTKMMEAGEIWLRRNKPFIKKIIATVSRKNLASLKLFQKAGFSSEFVIFFKNL